MIRYLGISVGMHVAALAAVFSVASLPRTDVVQSEAGDTVTLTFHGNVNPNRQVVESVTEMFPEETEKNSPAEKLHETTIQPTTAPPSRQSIAPVAAAASVEKTEPRPMQVEVREPGGAESPMIPEKVKKEPMAAPASASSVSGGHSVPARNVRCPAPPFPERARRFRIEGQVRVAVQIGNTGRVSEVDIVESSGRSDFDRAARATILKHWRYQPALKWGQPVASRETVLVEFRLQR